MPRRENSLAEEFSIKWLIDLLLLLSVLSTLYIPAALAQEPRSSTEVAGQKQQPAIPATNAPGTDQAMTQALETYTAKSSVDFLMEAPPLTQSTSPEANPLTLPAPQLPPVPLEVLQGRILEEAEEVAMLVSEQCSQGGSAAEGASSCRRVYSNGHHATVVTQNADEGDEFKRQTVIEEFDSDNTLLFRKTIRYRRDYNYRNDQKTKEKEFFDITYQPAGKKTTRELMVYEYFLDTGKTRSLAWTQYKQIGSEPRAELAYNALLRYGTDGSPERGTAEQWHQGVKTAIFLDWNRHAAGFATLDPEQWKEWEGWIRSVSLQAYLP